MSRLSHYRLRMIALALLAGALAMFPPGNAEAKREVTGECKWFGTAPLCDGECPKGWTLTKHSKTGGGNPCLTGSYARCCDFQEHCVPDYDSTYDPTAKRKDFDRHPLPVSAMHEMGRGLQVQGRLQHRLQPLHLV